MMRHFVMQPLPASFMLISMIGFLLSAFWVWPLNMTWGFTFCLMFAIWFFASVYNFTHALDEDELAVHELRKRR